MKEPAKDCPIYDLAGIVDTQKQFFASGTSRNLSYRLERLAKLEAGIIREGDALLAALASDLGKPALEAYVAEYHFVLTEIRLFRKKLTRWARPQRVGTPFYSLPARSEIRREAYGVALIAAPWNYPFQLSLSPLVAAVAAGNCVVLKPSELAPATAGLLSRIVAAVFDPGHVTVVEGGPETGKELLAQSFDFWFYTGSEGVGRLYAEAAARTLAPVALELGGKCPCLIDGDVDLRQTVERVITAKFFNAGQTCIAPDFVLVPEPLKEAFVSTAREILTASYGKENRGDLAVIVNANHYRRLAGLTMPDEIRIGEDDPDARHLAPRLLPGADWDSPAMQEEIFGPLLPVDRLSKPRRGSRTACPAPRPARPLCLFPKPRPPRAGRRDGPLGIDLLQRRPQAGHQSQSPLRRGRSQRDGTLPRPLRIRVFHLRPLRDSPVFLPRSLHGKATLRKPARSVAEDFEVREGLHRKTQRRNTSDLIDAECQQPWPFASLESHHTVADTPPSIPIIIPVRSAFSFTRINQCSP